MFDLTIEDNLFMYNETIIYFKLMYCDYILFSFSYNVDCQKLLETCQVLSSDQIVSRPVPQHPRATVI